MMQAFTIFNLYMRIYYRRKLYKRVMKKQKKMLKFNLEKRTINVVIVILIEKLVKRYLGKIVICVLEIEFSVIVKNLI